MRVLRRMEFQIFNASWRWFSYFLAIYSLKGFLVGIVACLLFTYKLSYPYGRYFLLIVRFDLKLLSGSYFRNELFTTRCENDFLERFYLYLVNFMKLQLESPFVSFRLWSKWVGGKKEIHLLCVYSRMCEKMIVFKSFGLVFKQRKAFVNMNSLISQWAKPWYYSLTQNNADIFLCIFYLIKFNTLEMYSKCSLTFFANC